MSRTKKTIFLAGLITVCCLIMALVDGLWQPHYAIKSIIKMILFLAVPFLYSRFDKSLTIKSLFQPNKKGLKIAFALCIPVFLMILGAYFLFRNIFDFSAVTTALTGNIGVTADNFIFVALYISFVNSLLEEFFFRGFAFLTLKKIASAKFAYLFSAAAFALYHIAIMTGWFSVAVFVISLAGLFAGGLIFNYLNDKSNNIYPSWFVHMFANFAINIIGFMLFGIL